MSLSARHPDILENRSPGEDLRVPGAERSVPRSSAGLTTGARRLSPGHPFIRAFLVAILACWYITGFSATGAEIDFYRDVYPILKSNCIACHNKTTHKAALNMETPEAMRKGGDSGPGIVPGDGAESLILQAAAHTGDVEMPPKGNKSGAVDLTPAELATLKTWIDQGAKSSVKEARQVVWQPLPPGVHPIYSVAVTRDGRLAACSRANQVFLYDLTTRQPLARLADDTLKRPEAPDVAGTAHRALVQALAFSPDGTRLASGSFRELKIWRQEAPPIASRKADPALGVVASTISEDGSQVVATDKQGALLVLDAASGKVLKTIPTGGKGAVTRISLAPDSSKAAVYGSDGVLGLWSLVEAKLIARKEGLAGVQALAWTRDGKAIAAAGDDKVVRVWPLPEGDKAELVASKELKGATGVITIMKAGTDAQSLVTAGADGKVRVWNIPEAKPVRELAIAGVVALGISADGKQLAAGRADGTVQVWDVAAGKLVITPSGDLETNARLAALDWEVAAEGLEAAFQREDAARLEADYKALELHLKKANDTIATVNKDLAEKRKALKTASDAKEAASKANDAITERVAKAPGGEPDAALEKEQKDAQDKLAAATMTETMALEAAKALEIHLKDAQVQAENFTAAQAKNREAVAAANAAATKAKAAQDKANADLAATRKDAAARKLVPLAVGFSPDAQTVAAVFSDGSMRVWAVASGLPVQHLAGGAAATTASIVSCADGAFAACTGDGATARVSTASRWILERVLGGESASSPFVDRVNAVRFSPDGKTLAAGGGEPTRSGDISLWDVASGRMIREWKERHTDAVLSLDFSPDGKRLVSGGADKIARVTEVATGKLLNVLEGHTHHVLGVSFRNDGRIVATSGGDGTVVIWDMLSGERKRKIEGWRKEVTSLQFLGATGQIVTSSGDSLVRVVDDHGGQVRAITVAPDFLQSAAGATNADAVVAGGEDSRLHVWSRASGQELATFGDDAKAKTP